MEQLNIERRENGFKVTIEGKPHHMIIMLGVLCADICEELKIPPDILVAYLPIAIRDAAQSVHRKGPGK